MSWNRKPARETGDMYRSTPYVWVHEDTGARIDVEKIFISQAASRSDYPDLDGADYIYVVNTPEGRVGKDYYKSESAAKNRAEKWAKNHQEGRFDTSKWNWL